MSTDHRLKLTQIKRFDQLIAYLRDEMGWPIARDSFDDVDDLFYEFSAEELGIDPKTSAKILEIKRLRPLSPKQPWGIFFVKFEPKKLPVIALRRILGQVALKRRSSANSPDRTAWSADDLLFISNYGDGDARQISFAHFSKSESSLDLPTLRVLGWNNLDTGLHLDAVAKELTENLTWPEEGGDLNQWRKSWSDVFKLGHNEVINTAKDLSTRLAELASSIRDRIKFALSIENDSGPLTLLKNAFKSSLVNDLDNDSFADMYAQTIAYGLLSARITDPSKKTVDDFTSHMRTSPFLRELMETFLKIGGRKGKAGGPGIDFDELGVGDVIQLLDNVNIEAVLRDFGDKNRQEDPVMHFFEGFLQAYDKKIRKDRGVFYTPQPVVSYIVRSVHELLQTEFGLTDGLADIATWGEMLQKYPEMKLPPLTDAPGERRTIAPTEPFVQILDPATGTATFLIEVIEVIHQTLTAKWKHQRHNETQQLAAWNDYVPKHLLPRLHAFELMMAPYAIAHMKVGLKLAETGYRFETEERARIYLTNALEPYQKQLNLPELDALAHEAASVNEIKRIKRFTVVIGNPPYSINSANKSAWIQHLIESYKTGLDETNINALSDDYVKFLRFSEHNIMSSRVGVIGMITNNSYIDGTVHRAMRASLIRGFNKLFLLDLHGSAKVFTKIGENGKDENVFDIQQGVAISIFVRMPHTRASVQIKHNSWIGERSAKFRFLSSNILSGIAHNQIEARPPAYFFKPIDLSLNEEYQRGWEISDVFRTVATGVKFRKDNLLVRNNFTKADVVEMLSDINSLTSKDLFEKYNFNETSDWQLSEKKRLFDLKRTSDIQRIAYRPLDHRFAYYPLDLINQIIVRGDSRVGIAKDMILVSNLALIVKRSRMINVDYFCHVCVVNSIPDINYLADQSYFAPLYTVRNKNEVFFQQSSDPQVGKFLRIHNLSERLVNSLKTTFALKFCEDGKGDLLESFGPDDIFYYIYAIFHCPAYRSRYADYLKVDFPRIPITANLDLFRSLVGLGGEIAALHLMQSPKTDKPIFEFFSHQKVKIEKISWSNSTVWLDKAQTIGFKGVSKEVWSFHIGGYQICEKWLKDRRDRLLLIDDIIQYQKIVVSLSETLLLMEKIDAVINQFGGWPGAFESNTNASF